MPRSWRSSGTARSQNRKAQQQLDAPALSVRGRFSLVPLEFLPQPFG
jgi:hypothetical protein